MRKTYGRLRAPLSIFAVMVAGLLAVPALASAVPGFQDNGITQGPDGNVWFTVFNTHRVGVITPAGAVQQFAGATSGPADIVTGRTARCGSPSTARRSAASRPPAR